MRTGAGDEGRSRSRSHLFRLRSPLLSGAVLPDPERELAEAGEEGAEGLAGAGGKQGQAKHKGKEKKGGQGS